jgi:hypothetical protein
VGLPPPLSYELPLSYILSFTKALSRSIATTVHSQTLIASYAPSRSKPPWAPATLVGQAPIAEQAPSGTDLGSIVPNLSRAS